ncbi:MAG: hypothetical protein WD875_11795 [Pirellulales bacterium]
MRGRLTAPAWLLSTVLHVAVLLLAAALTATAPRGAADEPSREIGIVLSQDRNEQREYFEAPTPSEHAADEDDPAAAGDQDSGNSLSAMPGQQESPLDVKDVLPDAPGAIPGAVSDGLVGNAGDATHGTGANTVVGGSVRTKVFGVEGTGYKFVYVFDRSDSMSEPQGRPMAAAKSELVASLRQLERTHQFQIIFFNHADPVVFNPTGQSGRLVFGDEANRRLAERFVASVSPSGGTNPENALVMALGMRPDVVFFLTDGQDLTLSSIDRVTKLNRGNASINAIEFGAGRGRASAMMVMLAQRNQGQAAYVDTSALGR